MDYRQNFINELYKINESNFNKKALEVFNYQYFNNLIYRKYCQSIGKTPENVNDLTTIPFLPVTFFKSETVVTGNPTIEKCFFSSGTTEKSTRSKHFVADLSLYKKSFIKTFEDRYGILSDYLILALLPSYQENEDSSLLYMIDYMINASRKNGSVFISTDYQQFLSSLPEFKKSPKKKLLIGVAYALLELAEYTPDLADFILMETGGMKGRRAEMIKPEMHAFLKNAFNVSNIHSEYGMTELLSQAYSTGEGIFNCPPWIKILIRQVNDPFDLRISGRGAINCIDLANIDSCSFVEIQDLGMLNHDGSFEVLGRMDNTELRGCNLLYV